MFLGLEMSESSSIFFVMSFYAFKTIMENFVAFELDSGISEAFLESEIFSHRLDFSQLWGLITFSLFI